MKPDLLDELGAVDPARRDAATPDWDAMAARILAEPRPARPRRLRPAFVLAPIAALVVLAVVALAPGGGPTTVLDRAYAAATRSAIYHYTVAFTEIEGGRAVPGTQSTREGWIDPSTGQIHEIFEDGEERAIDRRGAAGDDVLSVLVRSIRAGDLRDEGTEVFEGRRVRRLVASNASQTWRQTFLVDAETYLPVLFRSDTGGERVIEERYGRFERLPDDTDRDVLEPTGRAQGPEPAPRPQ